MKVFIAGSMHFSKQMVQAQKFLEKAGYKTAIPSDAHDCIENPELNMDDEHCWNTDIMRSCMNQQKECDAILVLNYPKDGLDGYIGGAVLIELGLAYFLGQKIFLLLPPPPKEKMRYTQEILHMKPIILNGDIENIKNYTSTTAKNVGPCEEL